MQINREKYIRHVQDKMVQDSQQQVLLGSKCMESLIWGRGGLVGCSRVGPALNGDGCWYGTLGLSGLRACILCQENLGGGHLP